MQKPEAYLLELTPEEKQILHKHLKKQNIRRLLTLGPLLIASVAVVFYLNNHMVLEIKESRLTLINVVLVIVAALSLRLLISDTIINNREMASFQKKVIQGTILEKEKNTLKIGHHEIEPGHRMYDNVSVGDKVEVYLSIKTEYLLGYKKL
jgi:hypothetical protein